MLVVGAPLAALAENEWGTGIRVHRRHFRTPRHETQRGREPARQAWSLRHRARALLVIAWTVATGERESIITSAVGERNMQPWVSRAQKRAS